MGTGDFVQLTARYIYIQTFMLLFDTLEYFYKIYKKVFWKFAKVKAKDISYGLSMVQKIR